MSILQIIQCFTALLCIDKSLDKVLDFTVEKIGE